MAAPPSYRAPRWLPGAHLQTIYPYLFRRLRLPALRRERWETPDADFVEVDWLDGRTAAPLVALFHGLEGCSRRHYARALLRAAHARGWRAVVPHFRGCGGEPNRLARDRHCAAAPETRSALRRAAQASAAGPRVALGVSLGGNAVPKRLARERQGAAALVTRAAVVSAPV